MRTMRLKPELRKQAITNLQTRHPNIFWLGGALYNDVLRWIQAAELPQPTLQ